MVFSSYLESVNLSTESIALNTVMNSTAERQGNHQGPCHRSHLEGILSTPRHTPLTPHSKHTFISPINPHSCLRISIDPLYSRYNFESYNHFARHDESQPITSKNLLNVVAERTAAGLRRGSQSRVGDD
ncbi:hypothetical protein FRC02_005293 [Tulasnella sp. 418]|nr:hypothetical protein FRC02_005293 [Tulasnella sp. 418]